MFGEDQLCKEQAHLYLSLGPRPWLLFPDRIHEGLMHLAPAIGWKINLMTHRIFQTSTEGKNGDTGKPVSAKTDEFLENF